MICPKCQGQMMTFERRGVHLEQCEGCRGIFLDRGELERIVDAEQQHYGMAPPPYGGQYSEPRAPYWGRADSPPPYHGGHSPYRGGYYSDSPPPYGGHRRRRRSFLEELFD